jgi:hypothetical protein
MDTELFKEFHHAFAMNAGACVHLETLYGDNSHHIAESGFKALARALRQAAERVQVIGLDTIEIIFRLGVDRAEHGIRIRFTMNMRNAPVIAGDHHVGCRLARRGACGATVG